MQLCQGFHSYDLYSFLGRIIADWYSVYGQKWFDYLDFPLISPVFIMILEGKT